MSTTPTLFQGLRCLVEELRSWSRLAELVDVAKRIEARPEIGHYGSDTVRELRKSLFKAEIEEAERSLEFRSWSDGAEHADSEGNRLVKAIAYYLDLPRPKSWSVDSLIEAVGRLER
jgi:hypothetical protein